MLLVLDHFFSGLQETHVCDLIFLFLDTGPVYYGVQLVYIVDHIELIGLQLGLRAAGGTPHTALLVRCLLMHGL